MVESMSLMNKHVLANRGDNSLQNARVLTIAYVGLITGAIRETKGHRCGRFEMLARTLQLELGPEGMYSPY